MNDDYPPQNSTEAAPPDPPILRSRSKRRAAAAAAGLGLLGMLLVWMLLPRGGPLFPALPPGSYVGMLEGFVDGPGQQTTMYFERLKTTDGLLLVVFAENWKSRLVPLQLPEGTTKETAPGYRPIEIEAEGRTLRLHGAGSDGEFGGTVEHNGQPAGQWSVRLVDVRELHAEKPTLPESFDFTAWLRVKGRHRLRAEELSGVQERLAAARAELVRIKERTSPESGLQQAGLSYRDELQAEVEQLRQQETEYSKRVNSLVQELEQLRRITKSGRSIDLARRVVTRENKWYRVNWAQGRDTSVVEDSLAGSMNIDTRKLNQRYERAREIKRLKNQIAKERALVSKLEREYKQKLKEGREKQQEREKQPWWKRLDSIFE